MKNKATPKDSAKKSLFGGIKINQLTIIFVILLSVVGLTIYNQNKSDDKPNTDTRAFIQTTDSSNTFSISYPDNWVIEPYQWVDCCEGPPKEEPDWTIQTKPITLHPKDNEKAKVTINRTTYGPSQYWTSFEAIKANAHEDYFAKVLFEGTRDDGRQALFERVDYLGPPDAKVESFTDHRYFYDYGISFISIEFREKYHHDWYPENDIDYSAYASDFEKIATSLKFLK